MSVSLVTRPIPNNTLAEMIRKFRFYERYGVEEYYVYDPDIGFL
jgi:Uma2 family endonuclease